MLTFSCDESSRLTTAGEKTTRQTSKILAKVCTGNPSKPNCGSKFTETAAVGSFATVLLPRTEKHAGPTITGVANRITAKRFFRFTGLFCFDCIEPARACLPRLGCMYKTNRNEL